MGYPIIFSLAVIATSILIVALVPSSSERQAEMDACQTLATQTTSGEIQLAEYMATRCSAKLLANDD